MIWPPGSGKTSIWKQFAEDQGMNFVDFDDDVLEKINKKVAKLVIPRHRISDVRKIVCKKVKRILASLWENDFMELEKNLGINLELENTVLSTSWSLPLHPQVMQYLRETGLAVYIDIPNETILQRMLSMQTDRIIGMQSKIDAWMTPEEALMTVLKERANVYETCYDLKFKTDWLKSKEEIFKDFIDCFNQGFHWKGVWVA